MGTQQHQTTTFQISTPSTVAAAAAARAQGHNHSATLQNGTSAGPPNGAASAPISPSTQNLLKRVGASTSTMNSMQGTPEWEAARQSVLRNMAGASNPFANGSPSSTSLDGDTIILARPMPAGGRGRRGRVGRPPSSGLRGRGRGGRPRGKRRRVDSDNDISSLSDTDEQESQDGDGTPHLPAITRSGRSVTKPTAFNPAPQASPNDGRGGARRRGSKKYSIPSNPENVLCCKCLRAHSPSANMIVFCDGCNTPWHQWCHDPLISAEAVEQPDLEWFCGACLHRRELQRLPLGDRVNKGSLTEDEQRAYLSALPSATLVSLLMHSLKQAPNLRLFDPDTQHLLRTKLRPPLSSDPYAHPRTEKDPYPDFSNPRGDPPATYPRPGNGPIKPRATIDADDVAYFLDDNSDVFSHLVSDGAGGWRKVDRSQGPGWISRADSNGQKVATNGASKDEVNHAVATNGTTDASTADADIPDASTVDAKANGHSQSGSLETAAAATTTTNGKTETDAVMAEADVDAQAEAGGKAQAQNNSEKAAAQQDT